MVIGKDIKQKEEPNINLNGIKPIHKYASHGEQEDEGSMIQTKKAFLQMKGQTGLETDPSI